MERKHLDEEVLGIVRRAWENLASRLIRDEHTGETHWKDAEGDVGLLKNVDALNAFLEPFLLAPKAFVEPHLDIADVFKHCERLVDHIATESQRTGHKKNSKYHGFIARPYAYVDVAADFVDCAASILRMICNVFDLAEVQRERIPEALQRKLSDTVQSAVEFLLESKIDEPSTGVRWQGIPNSADSAGRTADLFFSHAASMALYRANSNSNLRRFIAQENRDSIEEILPRVAAWVRQQYEPGIKNFWMDAGKSINHLFAVPYALEIVYTLLDPLPPNYRDMCREALQAAVYRFTDLRTTASFQTDFFHNLVLPDGGVVAFYDDRKYIGSFLTILALAKSKDPDVVNADFRRAGELLYQGMQTEWVDDSGMWDDGRPLICFTLDALVAIVRHALEGEIPTFSFREDDLRRAVRNALQKEEIVTVVVDSILEAAQSEANQAIVEKLRSAKAGE